jgi:glycosyltransferase involved in cell wall biosynthesis
VRVLVVTNLYPTARRPGLGPFVRDQVEALRALPDIEVELHSFDPPGGIRPYLSESLELRRRYRGSDYDVIHSHYGLTGFCALALRGARARAVTFHGDDLRLAKVAPISRLVARLSELPATVSAGLARSEARGLGGPGTRRRVAVLPCGIDLDRLKPIPRIEARQELGLDPNGRYLLFPADPARPEKRVDLARQLVPDDVELIHYDNTPPERVPLYINAANAVLVTSEREGFGLAPLEALACDVPVLATDVGIASLALAGIPGTLCAPFQRDAWQRALTPHLHHADPRIQGRARAALFGSRRMAERVACAYRDLRV